MSTKFELIGIMIRDPLDDEIPPEKMQIVTSDPFSEEELLIDPNRVAKKYQQINEERIASVRTLFKKLLSDLLILHTNEDYEDPIRKFFMGV